MAKGDRHRGEATEESADAAADRVRIDRWLWAARFYKSRTQATAAVEAGQARCNDLRVKPAHPIRVGDTIAIRRQGYDFIAVVAVLSGHRGAACIAATLYRETEACRAEREQADALRRTQRMSEPEFTGRPTKRNRRRLEAFKQRSD